MPAPKNNKYWLFREKDGREKDYTPQEWLAKIIEYCEWAHERTWIKQEAIKSGEHAGKLIEIPTSAPMSIAGFCLFAGVDKKTFSNYEKKEGYEEYFQVTAWGRDIIETQQFEGAVVGVFNQNIIARTLGLVEKTDITTDNKPINNTIDVKVHRPKD